MKLYRLNRLLHRDIGYFFVGMIIIYAMSGIALNHRHQWNPNYIIRQESFVVTIPELAASAGKNELPASILKQIDGNLKYKTHLLSPESIKIFVEGGSVTVELSDGNGKLELIRKRPVFNEFNFLHYNKAGKLWTWFSDIFCIALIFLAVSGLFIIKGKKGIKGRGAWMAVLGAAIPLLLFLLYAG